MYDLYVSWGGIVGSNEFELMPTMRRLFGKRLVQRPRVLAGDGGRDALGVMGHCILFACGLLNSRARATPNGFLGLRGPAHLLQRGPK